MPKVVSQLLERLQQDFPVVPELLGNLVPHQINLWIGAAPEGISRPVQVASKRKISRLCVLGLEQAIAVLMLPYTIGIVSDSMASGGA